MTKIEFCKWVSDSVAVVQKLIEVVFEGVGVFELFPGAAAVGKVKHAVFPDQIVFESEFSGLSADMNVEPVFLRGKSLKVIHIKKFAGDQRTTEAEAA